MKKLFILIAAAAAAMLSCTKETLAPEVETETFTPITFNLTAKQSDATRAVKTNWQAGDAIFVFFDKVSAPKYLKIRFDGTDWSSEEYNGDTVTPGALGLSNGASGTMRAVYLPFGSNATVSADGTSFVFSKTYYTFYSTGTLPYSVQDNQVSGDFNMVIPDDYVQFSVFQSSAIDEVYSLGCDAVIPVGVASVSADGTIVETTDKNYADDMPGYVYQTEDFYDAIIDVYGIPMYFSRGFKGYVFSGKLNPGYSYGNNYYFSLSSNNERQDYFVTGHTLASHSAIKLPDKGTMYRTYDSSTTPSNKDGKWVPVGSNEWVLLGHYDGNNFVSYGKWATCNLNSASPEDPGTPVSYGNAGNLPSRPQFETLMSCTWKTVSIHGTEGVVAQAPCGFIFLPTSNGSSSCYYWTSSENAFGQWTLSPGRKYWDASPAQLSNYARNIK